MRSVVVSRTGGPEVLEVVEHPDPAPGPGEVLVDVAAAGINFIDVYQREGRYPMVPGSGYTSAAVVPADRLVPVPDGVSTEQAAAVLLQGMTAHFLCETTFPVQPGQDVLVHAAAGGVGLLLTQMVARKGARVIGTVSTDEKEALARGAGAAEVVRYDREDVAEQVGRLTGGRGVAVVYDGVGQATFEASLASLARRGMLVLFGASSGAVPPFDPIRLMSGSLFLTRPTLGHYVAEREELLARSGAVLAQVADGTLDVRIGARYALEEAPRAHEDLSGRRTTGKSLIVP